MCTFLFAIGVVMVTRRLILDIMADIMERSPEDVVIDVLVAEMEAVAGVQVRLIADLQSLVLNWCGAGGQDAQSNVLARKRVHKGTDRYVSGNRASGVCLSMVLRRCCPCTRL